MLWFSLHLTDDELLLVTDDELSPRRRLRARHHLSGCPSCRTRLAQIEQRIGNVSTAHCMEVDRPLPSAAAARARLARRLVEEAERSKNRFLPFSAPMPGRQLLYGAAVLLIALAGGFLLQGPGGSSTPVAADVNGVFLRPRPDFTPGAAAPVALQDICEPDRPSRTQPIAPSVHHVVFARYGADYRRAADYELDYLITPELGGVADERNLWPQPFARTPWNAYVKDELERLFHRLVCERKLDLATAQREMASDWISAYKRYFQTNSPLRDYDAAPLTALDRDLILSELDELGVATTTLRRSDGAALIARLRLARDQSVPSQVNVKFAVFRHPAP